MTKKKVSLIKELKWEVLYNILLFQFYYFKFMNPNSDFLELGFLFLIESLLNNLIQQFYLSNRHKKSYLSIFFYIDLDIRDYFQN
ncbi:hypothetical protein SAMN04487893_11825 [Myroides guanonis]|uniref:Uncharacterized protein n=1 Tax=Myroides guanonis TaxID=1150112 RepID=A0A1I3UJN2_9FLAO|nr:hypothetical protein SAMN04487893_11825 [Myroides guanonis]